MSPDEGPPVQAEPTRRYTRPVLLLAACAPDPVPEATPWVDPAADDTWPVGGTDTTRAPAWDGQGVADQVDLATSTGLPTPQRVIEVYRELLSHGNDVCPGHEFEGGFVMLGGCTTDEGYHYSGAAGIIEEDSRVWTGDDWTGSVRVTSAPADYVITRPDGDRLAVGGTLRIDLRDDGSHRDWSVAISGTFHDDAGTDWLGEDFSGVLELRGSEDPGRVQQRVNGSLSLFGASMDFQDLEVQPDTCPDGFVGGTIRVRQPDATWNELVLPGGCSPCGEVTWEGGAALGQGCVDPAPWMAVVDQVQVW